METKKVEVYVSTRMFEGDDPVKTKLTIDVSSLTDQDILEYAVDSLKIKWQNALRRKKDSKIPAEATYVAPKPGSRSAPTLTPYQALEVAFGKERMLALVNAANGDVEAVIKKFQCLLNDVEEDM